jgi:hypothetical protein
MADLSTHAKSTQKKGHSGDAAEALPSLDFSSDARFQRSIVLRGISLAPRMIQMFKGNPLFAKYILKRPKTNPVRGYNLLPFKFKLLKNIACISLHDVLFVLVCMSKVFSRCLVYRSKILSMDERYVASVIRCRKITTTY